METNRVKRSLVNRLANKICRQNSIAKIMTSQTTSRSTAIYIQ